MTLRKFIAPSTLSSQRKILCHFDLREKSFLDPWHPLRMTALGPSPWRPLRSLRETQSYSVFPSFQNFKYAWLEFIIPFVAIIARFHQCFDSFIRHAIVGIVGVPCFD